MQKKQKKIRSKVSGPKDFDRRQTRFVLYNTLPQMPDEFDTVVVSGLVVDNAGATAAVTGFVATNSLLTSSGSGVSLNQNTMLDELVRMYESYRVVAYEMDYRWVSRNSVDANWCLIQLNEDPSFATGGSWDPRALTYPNVFHLLVPGTGKSPCAGMCKTPKFWLADLVGSKTFETDDSYAGTVSNSGVFGAPATLTYSVYYSGLITGASFTSSTSPYVVGRLKQYVKFYGRRQ